MSLSLEAFAWGAAIGAVLALALACCDCALREPPALDSELTLAMEREAALLALAAAMGGAK